MEEHGTLPSAFGDLVLVTPMTLDNFWGVIYITIRALFPRYLPKQKGMMQKARKQITK